MWEYKKGVTLSYKPKERKKVGKKTRILMLVFSRAASRAGRLIWSLWCLCVGMFGWLATYKLISKISLDFKNSKTKMCFIPFRVTFIFECLNPPPPPPTPNEPNEIIPDLA